MNLKNGENIGIFPTNIEEIGIDELIKLIEQFPFSTHLQNALYLKRNNTETLESNNDLVLSSMLSSNRTNLFLLGKQKTDSATATTPSNQNFSNNKSYEDEFDTVFDIGSNNASIEVDKQDINNIVDITANDSLVNTNFDNSMADSDVSEYSSWLSDLTPPHGKSNSIATSKINFEEELDSEDDVDLILDYPTEKKKKKSKKKKKKKINSKKKQKKKKVSKKKKSKIYESNSYEDMLISPTLALILEKQGSFDPAIRMYEKLILKFPEKSSFFAARIKKLKK